MESSYQEPGPSSSETDGLSAKQAVQMNSLDANSKNTEISQTPVEKVSATCVPVTTKATKKKKKKKKVLTCQHPNCKAKIKKMRSFLACRCGGHFCRDHSLQVDHNCTAQGPKVKKFANAKAQKLVSF